MDNRNQSIKTRQRACKLVLGESQGGSGICVINLVDVGGGRAESGD